MKIIVFIYQALKKSYEFFVVRTLKKNEMLNKI